MVESAAYNDPISAAVFNPAVWALPGNEALDLVCRRLRGTQIRARSIDDPKLWLGAGSAGQLDWDEVPRRPAGKVQFSPELTVQLPGIAAGHAARVTDCVYTEPGQLVHVAQHGTALRLRQSDGMGVESAQAI